ncbi:hypothetical protein JCM10213_003825 [Rhodosporidiobolus nylandii]
MDAAWAAWDGFARRWLRAHSVDVGLLLQSLPTLVQLHINKAYTGGDFDDRFLQRYQEYVQDITLPAVTDLSIPSGFSDVAEAFPNLRRLSCTNAPSEEEAAPLATALPHLEVGYYPSSWGPPPFDETWEWLSASSVTTLTSLSLYWDEGFRPSLAAFTALADLTIEFRVFNHPSAATALFRDAAFCGPLTSFPPSLRTLTHKNSGDPLEPTLFLHETFLVHLPRALRALDIASHLFAEHVTAALIKSQEEHLPALKRLTMRYASYSKPSPEVMAALGELCGEKRIACAWKEEER